jgi:hypothetical protein
MGLSGPVNEFMKVAERLNQVEITLRPA